MPAALVLHSLVREHASLRIWFLICISLVFYTWWYPPYLLLLLASILANWLAAKLFAGSGRTAIITAMIAADLAVLAFFKYAGFLIGNLHAVGIAPSFQVAVFLPLAVSFFTFHHIAYLVDLKRGDAKVATLPQYALLVTFFPHLIAGPIVRYREFVPQLGAALPAGTRAEMAGRGCALLVIGLMKKLLLADELAGPVNQLFAIQHLTFAEAWIAALGFSFQIYFDFSGYTDMALGLAMMFGLRLPPNFDSPYKAGSLIEFWRRWHMSLSRFLRDYLYVPLGGSRHGLPRMIIALLVTMLLGGLWHGAEWTFVVWGAVHGIGLAIARLWTRFGFRLPWAFGWALTFVFVVLAFVIFRASSLGTASHIIQSALGLHGFSFDIRLHESGWRPALLLYPWRDALFMVVAAACVCLGFPNSGQLVERLSPRPVIAYAVGLVLAGCFLFMGRGAQEFVYFQF